MTEIYPKRIAAIDIGTNSFHMIVVEVLDKGKLKIIDRQREFLRLGSASDANLSHISADEMQKAVSVLKNFAALASLYKANIKAVSTSAVREADNKDEFIEKVFIETGIKVETIEGTLEAKLIFLGMKNALPIDDKKVLGIDIGGGSTEFIYGINGNPFFAESVKIGAVRLSKKFFADYKIAESNVEECGMYAEQLIRNNQRINLNINIDFAIGSSGTVDTICMIKNFQRTNQIKSRLNGYSFTDIEFFEVYDSIMKLKSPEERLKIPGIEKKRADIIPAGLIILRKIFELFHIKKMVLSEYALREGVVFDLLNNNV